MKTVSGVDIDPCPPSKTWGAHSEASPRYGWPLAVSFAIFLAAFALALRPAIVDLPLTTLFNSLAGRTPLLDLMFYDFDNGSSFSGAVIVALLWGCWFSGDQTRKARILAGSLASFVAGLISRRLQHALPTHLRPFYDPAVHFHYPLYTSHTQLNTWYSFPSDHVAIFAGLLTVVWLAGSRFRLPATVWLILVESSRVYEGAHFPSDLIGGAALASTLVWASQSPAVLRQARRLLRFELNSPALFYVIAFFFCFQLATLFGDFRNAGYALKALYHHEPSALQQPAEISAN